MGSIGSKGKKCPKGCYPVPQQQKACPTAYPPMMRPQAPPITQQYHMPQMQMPQVKTNSLNNNLYHSVLFNP